MTGNLNPESKNHLESFIIPRNLILESFGIPRNLESFGILCTGILYLEINQNLLESYRESVESLRITRKSIRIIWNLLESRAIWLWNPWNHLESCLLGFSISKSIRISWNLIGNHLESLGNPWESGGIFYISCGMRRRKRFQNDHRKPKDGPEELFIYFSPLDCLFFLKSLEIRRM